MKKILLICIFAILPFFHLITFADDDSWTLIPEWDASASKTVWETPWKVWETYNNNTPSNVWDAFASWVFSWDTIFDFFKHIAKILSEMWLVIWAGMIIYAWYKYASGVFTGDASKWWKDAIKWAIYGVLIVIFSYAIMKILLAMFL